MSRVVGLPSDIPPALVAQTSASRGEIFLWVGILLGAALLGSVIILFVRSRLMARGDADAPHGSLMDQLREMRDRGDMSPEEFEATRRRIIEKTTGKPLPTPGASAEAKIAAPGFDLTGAPLPNNVPSKRPSNRPSNVLPATGEQIRQPSDEQNAQSLPPNRPPDATGSDGVAG